MRKITYFLVFSLFVLVLSACGTKQFTISFESNSEVEVESIVLNKGDEIDLPEPTRVGYDFKGWFEDENLETPFRDETLTKDVKLYAKWKIKTYTVRFLNGTVELKKETVEHGKSATAPDAPNRVGHEFKAWDKEFTNVTSDLVVNAIFENLKYNVKFMNGEEQIGETQVIIHGNGATAPANPEKLGYDFVGWDKEFTNVTSDLVVNAIFEIKKFMVTFIDMNGNQLSQVEVEYGKSATAPDAPAISGYEFTGWDKEFAEVKSNMLVSAVYTAIEYTISYQDKDTSLELLPNKYTIKAAVTLPEGPVKNGFIFVGWYYNSDFTDEVVKTIPAGQTGNKKLYAKYLDTSLKHNVEYELNGGSWTWTTGTPADSAKGIDSVSTLPETFMLDFYTYLKDNNLLNSEKVHSSLRKTTWADFSKPMKDPIALYNNTSTNTSQTPDGYSQFFYDTATGDPATGKITSITGGFFGSKEYGAKYASLAQVIAYLQLDRSDYGESGKLFWGGNASKALAGFILDGYFYGTQGLGGRSDKFKAYRGIVPEPHKGYEYVNNALVAVDLVFPVTSYVQGLEGVLSTPTKDGFIFAGWYDNPEFTGTKIISVPAGETPKAKYYAKWVSPAEY